LKTADFNYNLPKELIAQVPLEDRTSSRLMIVNRKTEEITNRKFTDIVNELDPGDCLVLNDTKVMPARLFGHRPGKEEKIEVLLLKRISNNTWECLVKPGKKNERRYFNRVWRYIKRKSSAHIRWRHSSN
jgi:S-adenosylmethionine--tRNA ribosyltransferase-isomerase